LGPWVDDVMIGVCFVGILMTSSVDPMNRYCGSKFYWILGYRTVFCAVFWP